MGRELQHDGDVLPADRQWRPVAIDPTRIVEVGRCHVGGAAGLDHAEPVAIELDQSIEDAPSGPDKCRPPLLEILTAVCQVPIPALIDQNGWRRLRFRPGNPQPECAHLKYGARARVIPTRTIIRDCLEFTREAACLECLTLDGRRKRLGAIEIAMALSTYPEPPRKYDLEVAV